MRMTEREAIECWHFVGADRRLSRGPREEVGPGSVATVDPPLELCRRGLHASIRAIDAIRYAPGPVVCRVGVWGEVIRGDDKLCGQHRRVLWLADATETLHRFACEVAAGALDLAESRGGTIDPRSREAIAVKLAWLRGEASDGDLAVASAAAWAAAWAAARAVANAAWDVARDVANAAARDAANAAARDAAWDAARAAAWDAARAAANAAWDVARDAAWDVARDAQDRRLHDLLMQLRPLGRRAGPVIPGRPCL